MKRILFLLVFCLPLLMSAQGFTITNFDINIDINKDGSFLVEETIDVYFSERKRGIFREIPNSYKKDNKTISLDISKIDVEDKEYKVDNNKNEVSIRIGSASSFLTGVQQYKISYIIQNGILAFPDHQEFHYDLTGDDWPADIENVDFTINLPKNITLADSEMKITGGRKNQNLDLGVIRQANSNTIKGNSIRKLNKNNGLTAAIRFPKRYLEVANNVTKFYESEQNKSEQEDANTPWYIAIPMLIFGWFFSFWRKMKVEGKELKNEKLMMYPPEGLTSAHVGAFEDQSTNTRDIVSLLPYWASEGFIEMKQIGEEVYLYKMKNLDPNFPEYEHIIFDKLFEDSEISKMSDLKLRSQSTISKARTLLTEEIKNQEYYNAKYLKVFKSWIASIFPISMIILGILSIVFINFFVGLAFILAALGGFFLSLTRIPLTKKGAKLKSEIDNFKDFLKDPDEDLLANAVKEDPNYFDKMFPFVIAFGFEKLFFKQMEPHMQYAPYWYITDTEDKSFTTFTENFKPEVITSAFTPNSNDAQNGSFGSGGGGGGFSSGSGVGGGGGGSW